MGNKVTLKQIAQEVGLSPSSVSLVLNNRPCRISEENRKRIKEVAAQNHYVPNQIARSLVMRESRTLGLIVPNIESRFFAPLEFGTAGLRGEMALGCRRMNIHVIRHATQAFAEVIKAEGESACARGIAICFDIRFSELFRVMGDKGAQLILIPAAFNMTTGPAHWELLLRQRAVDNQCFTVGAAPARDEAASYVAWGHSLICDPWGTVLHECGSGEETAVVDLDLSRVDSVRQQLPILSARRTDIYDIRLR